MASLGKRLREDEAAIASLASEVNNLKKFKVGDRTITMREVPSSRGFPFVTPPAASPRVNVNVQAPSVPRRAYVDVREGERQAYLSGYRNVVRNANNYNPSIAVGKTNSYRSRLPFMKKKAVSAAKARSKASLAKARTSAKKGGSRPSKATLLKAGQSADKLVAYRMWMRQTKARLLTALKSRRKYILARCLANS